MINAVLLFGFLLSVILVIFFVNGIFLYITISGSMEPKIQTGSLCFVDTRVSYDEIKTGDIIAFENFAGNMVTHRVVSVAEAGLETKGDANNVSDGVSVTENNFHGKTLFSIPYAGYVLNSFKQYYKEYIIAFIFIGTFNSLIQKIYRRT